MLSCVADGLPRPEVTWLKDGVRIDTTGSSRYTPQRNGSLQLSTVTVDDAGLYECVASNDAGTVRREIVLSVQGTLITGVNPPGRHSPGNYPLEKFHVTPCGSVRVMNPPRGRMGPGVGLRVSASFLNFRFKNIATLCGEFLQGIILGVMSRGGHLESVTSRHIGTHALVHLDKLEPQFCWQIYS